MAFDTFTSRVEATPVRRSRSLLFAVLLIAGCVTDSAYKQEEQKANTSASQAATYQKLDTQLQTEVKADQVQIQQLQGQLKVTIVNEILFPEGGWELNRAGEQTLDKIIPTLKTLENQRIEVDGYTDNVPIGPELKSRFPSNWELSTARATDVAGEQGRQLELALRNRLRRYAAGGLQ
jgi:chemotaxis protein MotB